MTHGPIWSSGDTIRLLGDFFSNNWSSVFTRSSALNHSCRLLRYQSPALWKCWKKFSCRRQTGSTKRRTGLTAWRFQSFVIKERTSGCMMGNMRGLLLIHASPTGLPLCLTHSHTTTHISSWSTGSIPPKMAEERDPPFRSTQPCRCVLWLELEAWPIFSPHKHGAGHPLLPPSTEAVGSTSVQIREMGAVSPCFQAAPLSDCTVIV